MFIGHVAVGFAAKRAAPRTSLGLLVAAPLFADMLWPIFLLLGWEHLRIDPDPPNPFLSLAFANYPISHSLLALTGWALLAGRVPLESSVLLVSGRVSFEVVQKAFRAGVPFVAGVSGVSSLACDLSRRAGITLAGFVRGPNFSIYACPERVEA